MKELSQIFDSVDDTIKGLDKVFKEKRRELPEFSEPTSPIHCETPVGLKGNKPTFGKGELV